MHSVRGIARRIAAGQSTPQAELDHAREMIAARDGAVAAFAAVSPDFAPGTGPLAGIAIGVKDIVDTADLPTGMGSPIYAGWRPRADAAIVTMLRAAGATLAGKTHTTPFAFMDPTVTLNPHDADATPGGSSSGSAAAVAAGMVPLSVGTQTGGSVIRPAAFCGVAGIKPSVGLLPTVGVKTFSWTLDTLGLMAKTANDLGLALAAIAGRAELDAPAADLRGLRVAITRQDFAGRAEPPAIAALDAVAELLRGAGAQVEALGDDPVLAEAFDAHGPIQDYEACRALGWEIAAHGPALPPKLSAHLEAARTVTPAMYDRAREAARRGRAALRDTFARHDVLLTYSAPGEAPASRETTGESLFNRLWTLMGVPCVTVPAGRGPRGLPLGVQLVAGTGRDHSVLAVAKALETLLRGTP